MSRYSDRSGLTAFDRFRTVFTRRYVPTLLLALLAALVVFATATELFPYHSNNHDEGVYLQQASMLLDGQLFLRPPAELTDEFRPWFFVVDGSAMYPKYAPVPAAMFALGMAVGVPRLVLAAIAAASTALVVALGTEAFDRRTGVAAGILLLLSPMFLLTSSVFLPYAPTTFLNLLFALAYVRAVRRRDSRTSLGYATAAGLAVALAFFARPFTALLFALPFVGHACWTLWVAARADGGRLRPHLVRNGVVAMLGLAGVGVTLGYNAVVTGDALLFPYEAFAPLDGLGFGRRVILDHELVWTPLLSLRTTAALLRQFALDWTAGGWLGTVAFLGGVGAWITRARAAPSPTFDRPHLSPGALRLLVIGVFACVVVGNLFFWGSYNVQAGLDRSGDGLMGLLGPFYHFDLLLPLSVFGAHGIVTGARRFRTLVTDRLAGRSARVAFLALLVLTVPIVGVAEQAALSDPVETNADHTQKYTRAYEPLESHEFENALVFVPNPYGDWMNHPFQSLRNRPGFDGDVVYGLHQDAESDFELLDAYPTRTPYRYTYHGHWDPDPESRVTPKLERLGVREGEQFSGTTRIGVPQGATSAVIRLEAGGDVREFYLDEPITASAGERLSVNWTLTSDGIRLTDENVRALGGNGPSGLHVDGAEEVAVAIVLNYDGGSTLTYRQEFSTRVRDGRVQVVWPPQTSVCRLTTDCGTRGTYLPDHPGTHLEGVWVNGTLTESEKARVSRPDYRNRSSRQTFTMDFAIAAPPSSGSSFVSPFRSAYSMGVSMTR